MTSGKATIFFAMMPHSDASKQTILAFQCVIWTLSYIKSRILRPIMLAYLLIPITTKLHPSSIPIFYQTSSRDLEVD